MRKKQNGQVVGKGDKTRARIVAYANRIFFERGFRKVTVEELCAGMAVSKRTFYQYFANRDELVEAVFTENLADLGPRLMANLNSDQPVDQVFRQHFELLLNMFSRVSTHMLADLQSLMPEVWDRIEAVRSRLAELMVELIRRGQKEGTVYPDFDPETAGKIFQGVLNNFARPDVVVHYSLSMPQVAATFEKLFMHGLLVQKTKGGGR